MTLAPLLLPDVRRIAVLRANAVGDFLFALPALEALRAAYPEAEITLLARDWHRDFLASRPSPVDRVVVVPPSVGVRDDAPPADPDVLDRFFARMHDEHFDLALQLHGGGRNSNVFLGRLGARTTAGLADTDAPPLDRWTRYVHLQPEVARYLEAVALVGAAPVTAEPRVTLTARDRAEVAALELPDGGLAALHAGAIDPRRRWPAERFAAVGDALAEGGLAVVLTGTGPERGVVDSVIGHMRHPAIDVCDRVSLGGLAALLGGCAVVVSNDSGPMHLAHAAGGKSVGIYWCANVVTGAPPTRARHRAIATFEPGCPVCGADCTRGDCGHRSSLVTGVSVAEVLAAAEDLAFGGPEPGQAVRPRAARIRARRSRMSPSASSGA